VTISNDGATIMRLLEIEHAAAKTLVDISMSQDAEVGDGTTSVVLLAAEILSKVKPFVEDGVHPQIISTNICQAGRLAVQKVKELVVPFEAGTEEHLLVPASSNGGNLDWNVANSLHSCCFIKGFHHCIKRNTTLPLQRYPMSNELLAF
jgi:chaperonin GroEL (HSP60 family)